VKKIVELNETNDSGCIKMADEIKSHRLRKNQNQNNNIII